MEPNPEKSPNILVLGDLMVDEYYVGLVHRMSPESPVPIVNVDKHFYRLGGAGNVISNLKSFGANFDIVGVIGACDASKIILSELSNLGCKAEYLFFDENIIMPKKTRIVAGSQQLIRYDIEEVAVPSESITNKIKDCFSSIINSYDLVLLSDYAKGLLNEDLTKFFIEESKRAGVRVLIDPKGNIYNKYKGAYCITPNKKELESFWGADIKNLEDLSKAMEHLKAVTEVEIAMATLSEEGIAFKQDELLISKTKARAVADVTGAGDTVIAALGFCFASGKNVIDSVEFANYAAGLVVEKPGVATATIGEILRFKEKSESNNVTKKLEINELNSFGETFRLNEKKIVFTNGCFDILHVGHIDYLQRSKELGDILIVGINSDKSVKRLKGSERPINNEDDRALIIAALNFVDHVVIFDEDTPINCIELLKPNIITKGGDWEESEVIGREIVDQVVLLPYSEGKSTTNIIKNIRTDND